MAQFYGDVLIMAMVFGGVMLLISFGEEVLTFIKDWYKSNAIIISREGDSIAQKRMDLIESFEGTLDELMDALAEMEMRERIKADEGTGVFGQNPEEYKGKTYAHIHVNGEED